MKKRRLNVLQRVGLALILGGTGIIICSVDPYSNDLLTNIDLLVRAAQAGIAGGCCTGRGKLKRMMIIWRGDDFCESIGSTAGIL